MLKNYCFTRIGPRHLDAGRENEDRVLVRKCSGYTLAVVADGMGSTAKGARAAEVAVGVLSDALDRGIHRDVPQSFDAAIVCGFTMAVNAVLEEAREGDFDASDYGTTLMAAVLEDEGGRLHYGAVGDGALIARSYESPEPFAVVFPQRLGEYGQTNDLLSGEFVFGSANGLQGVLLATDGVGDVVADYSGNPNDLARELLNWPSNNAWDEQAAHLDDVLSAEDDTVFGAIEDDRTIAILMATPVTSWPFPIRRKEQGGQSAHAGPTPRTRPSSQKRGVLGALFPKRQRG